MGFFVCSNNEQIAASSYEEALQILTAKVMSSGNPSWEITQDGLRLPWGLRSQGHGLLVHTYEQTEFTGEPPYEVRLFRVGDPTHPIVHLSLNTRADALRGHRLLVAKLGPTYAV